MARARKAHPTQNADTPTPPEAEPATVQAPIANEPRQADAQTAEPPPAGEAPPEGKTKWYTRIGGGWADAQAGVHLIEDHRNRRMTIKFDEKPSEAIRKLMKEEYGYRFDGENQLWYKSINPATPRQYREEGEELAFQVASMIREERGLEQPKSFLLGV